MKWLRDLIFGQTIDRSVKLRITPTFARKSKFMMKCSECGNIYEWGNSTCQHPW